MPLVRPCTFPGCNTLVVRGRCPKHAYPDRSGHNLKYGRKPWKDLRAAKLRDEPFCAEHLKRDELVAAECVDHIDGDAGNDAPENLQSLCYSCHAIKTAKEQGGFGNRINGKRRDEAAPGKRH